MQKVNKEPTNNADKPVEKDEEIEALIKRVNNELKYDNFEEE